MNGPASFIRVKHGQSPGVADARRKEKQETDFSTSQETVSSCNNE
jgi:hypothetical protein